MPLLRPVAARLIALATLGCAACSGEGMIRRFTPADADARARASLAQLARAQVDSIEARLVPSLAGPEAHEELRKIAGALATNERFDSLHVIGAQVNIVNGIRHTNLTYEFHGRTGWMAANLATIDSAGTWFVEGVSAQPLAQSLERIHAFSLGGKSALHYLWLLLTLLCAAASLGAAAFLATRRGMPRRWGWALLALVGVGACNLNWTTGETTFNLLNIQIFSAGAVKAGLAAPWILVFALPLGALLAVLRYRRWRARADAAALAATETWAPPPAPGPGVAGEP